MNKLLRMLSNIFSLDEFEDSMTIAAASLLAFALLQLTFYVLGA